VLTIVIGRSIRKVMYGTSAPPAGPISNCHCRHQQHQHHHWSTRVRGYKTNL